jgi:branched-chain amino acid transport system substrate-binding protein
MKKFKFFSRVLSIVVVGVAVIGFTCVPSITEAKTLKVACITALSGQGAVWGRGILHGATLAIEEANAKGGVTIGDEKYKIKLIQYDDKYTAAGGVAAAHKAVFSDKVKFIIGPISSASGLAMQDITEKNKVILIADTWARDFLGPKKPYTFRVFMTSTQAAPGLARWTKKLYPNAKTVALIAANDASGWSIMGDYGPAYEKVGVKTITKELPERTTKDFYPVLTRIKGKDPDLIQECAFGVGAAALLTKQRKELGVRAPIIGGAWVDPKNFVKNAGGAEMAEGYVYPVVFNRKSKDPALVEFMKKFRKKYGEQESITTVDPSFYDGTRLFFAALEKAGCTDPDKVKEALESIQEFQGILGKMRWIGMETYGINHQILQSFYIAQIKNGEEVILERVE